VTPALEQESSASDSGGLSSSDKSEFAEQAEDQQTDTVEPVAPKTTSPFRQEQYTILGLDFHAWFGIWIASCLILCVLIGVMLYLKRSKFITNKK